MSAVPDSLLFEHSGEILLLVDPATLAIGDASAPALRLLGYSRAELLGRHITDVECSLADARYWEEVRQGGSAQARNAESSYRCASGDILPAKKTVLPAARAGKSWLVVRAEPQATDPRMDEQLSSTLSLLRATLEATADGILLLDHTGGILNMNQRFARMWELPHDLLAAGQGRAILDYMASCVADARAYAARLQHIAASGESDAFDLLQLANGRVLERKARVVRLGARVIGRVFSFTDITARAQAESARAQLEAQLRESQKMEALGTLAGGVAHDFNNIVAAILGNVELARMDLEPEHVAQESLREILKAGRRAKSLVQQILAFGRRQVVQRRVISLAPAVEESARLLRVALPAAVSLSVECAADAPPVLADPAQVEQVLLNLCSNAWQVLQGLGRPGLIKVRLEAHDEPATPEQARAHAARLRPGRYARLSVCDDGPGMDQATLGRIFEPFFTTKPVGQGTGLGLAVVHGIVEGHDGCIEVQSVPGEGTCFLVYFPEAAQPAAPQAVPDKLAPARTGSGKRILCVDDDESIVFLMSRLLERQGYRVSAFSDPHAAIEALRADPGRFDLAVTDYNMPGMSGLDVARALREIRPELPIALASGYITEELRAQAPAAGIVELVYKPNTAEEFCEAVARLANSQAGEGDRI